MARKGKNKDAYNFSCSENKGHPFSLKTGVGLVSTETVLALKKLRKVGEPSFG